MNGNGDSLMKLIHQFGLAVFLVASMIVVIGCGERSAPPLTPVQDEEMAIQKAKNSPQVENLKPGESVTIEGAHDIVTATKAADGTVTFKSRKRTIRDP